MSFFDLRHVFSNLFLKLRHLSNIVYISNGYSVFEINGLNLEKIVVIILYIQHQFLESFAVQPLICMQKHCFAKGPDLYQAFVTILNHFLKKFS